MAASETKQKQISSRSIPGKIFISSDEKRLRAGWRLLIHLLFVGFGVLLFAILIMVTPIQDIFDEDFLLEMFGGIAIVLATWAARKWIDKRSFGSLGVTLDAYWWKDLVTGIGIAALLKGFIFFAHLGTGMLNVSGFAWQIQPIGQVLIEILEVLIIYLAVGFYEELFSRGYLLQNLEEGRNTGWAIFLSSIFFSLFHLSNPRASWLSLLGIIIGGLFFAYAYLRTRTLWISVGLHIGWNFFLGPVFGFPVSGTESVHLLQNSIEGPVWFTGGTFGPEAGISGMLAMLIGIILISFYTKNRLR